MTPTAVQPVRTATMNDVPAVARVLGRALYHDPLFRWLFPDDDLRMAQNFRACALLAGFGHVPGGHATVAESPEGPARIPVVRGAALWTPPGAGREGAAVPLRSLPHWFSLVGLSRLPELTWYNGEVRASVPEGPHWYLCVLGADPATDGTDTGARLLREGLARADADGVPVYLETADPADIGYYKDYDFRVVRAVHPPAAPSTYCMLRPAAF
ncbi:GNAT family N-acetyltransferase [Nocardiopsis dassonvillei]|uniref:GNAT family N-acetyltransferase n=1 Tax=Nocardiopsis dassonvillei TaxID=2014 RepID=UPI0008FC37F4|nr:GNAT family N-acetyltransferase [Nocardiopsis dassonvillei]APC37333.1 GNAT family N-acetyltransferase [Nocardiopsis dassonvillei]